MAFRGIIIHLVAISSIGAAACANDMAGADDGPDARTPPPQALVHGNPGGVVPPGPPTGSIAFPEGDEPVFVGDVFTKQAVTDGTSSIVYSSADPSIATVDQNGTVTAVGPGLTEITATLTNRSKNQVSASYQVLASFVASAWVGADDTELTYSVGADGFQLYRSTDPQCDITNILGCADGQTDTLVVGDTYVDTAFNLSRPGYYTYVGNGTEHFRPMSRNPMPEAYGMAAAVFHGRIFISGGSYQSSVWSSADGSNWIEETADAGFAGRNYHTMTVYDDKLWVIGGEGASNYSDVWYSADGATWTRASASAPFGPRYFHDAFAFNGKLWMVGGWDGNAGRTDVWSTTDGATWTEETADAGFPASYGIRVMVRNDTIFLITEGNDLSNINEVWSSTDGVNWTQAAAATSIPPRSNFDTTVFEDKLWLIGGYSSGPMNDIWWSDDGVTWTRSSASDPFLDRYNEAVLAFDNRMWVLGGGAVSGQLHDAWWTLDGITWIQESIESGLTARFGPGMTTFAGKMWLYGGAVGGGSGNTWATDIWSSEDGISWTQEPGDVPWGARIGVRFAELGGYLWAFGGIDKSQNYYNDAWRSADGVTWTQMSADAGYPARYSGMLAELNGTLWMVGGTDSAHASHGDVWYSTDGTTWNKALDEGPFGIRSSHQLVSMNGALWLMGGRTQINGSNVYASDVWTSTNGTDWTELTDAAGFTANYANQLVASDTTLYVVGPGAGGNFVWSSTNGVDWTEQTAAAAFPLRRLFGLVYFDQKLIVAAGLNGNYGTSDVWSSHDGATWRLGHRTVITF